MLYRFPRPQQKSVIHTQNNLIRGAQKSGHSSYLTYKAVHEGILNISPSIMDWMDTWIDCDGGVYVTFTDRWNWFDLFNSVKLKDKEAYLNARHAFEQKLIRAS